MITGVDVSPDVSPVRPRANTQPAVPTFRFSSGASDASSTLTLDQALAQLGANDSAAGATDDSASVASSSRGKARQAKREVRNAARRPKRPRAATLSRLSVPASTGSGSQSSVNSAMLYEKAPVAVDVKVPAFERRNSLAKLRMSKTNLTELRKSQADLKARSQMLDPDAMREQHDDEHEDGEGDEEPTTPPMSRPLARLKNPLLSAHRYTDSNATFESDISITSNLPVELAGPITEAELEAMRDEKLLPKRLNKVYKFGDDDLKVADFGSSGTMDLMM